MTTVTYTDLRAHLAHFLRLAEEDEEEIVVSHAKGRKAIILSLEEFESLQETAYLLSTKKNRRHLEKSLREARQGKVRRLHL
ncbi:type II toxin-antitoxin system prevent-host-death family antitoxin [Candidatus Peregrinibacteria bacterium]|nr:type II toxin-antitoxin system prevent-host-death family antitoxin [Candidatus Peregrinibacteria bacterium]